MTHITYFGIGQMGVIMLQKSILFLFLFSTICAEIIEVDSFDKIEGAFDFLKKDTLVVFDLDHTLIRPKDGLFQTDNLGMRDEIFVAQSGNDWKECKDCIRSEWYRQRAIELVNPKSLALIEKLQSKGVKVIALTHSRVGPMGYLDRFETFRVDELKKLGIDFSKAFDKMQLISFLEWQKEGVCPLYLNGVLFTAHRMKGELLNAFLERVDFTPRRVIMLDDTLVQLRRVEKAMGERNIPFLGFHYVEAFRKSKKVNPLLAHLQVERLVKEGVWMSDEEIISWVQEYQREDR